MQLLETKIACMKKLQLAMRQEEARAKKLLKRGSKAEAQGAARRIQIIGDELSASS